MTPPLRIALLHPDLGLGGAERLMLDAALCLQEVGHRVTLYTGRHDPARSFEETRDGRVEVRLHGGRLPGQLGGHLRAPLSIARTAVAAWALARPPRRFDLVLCDLVAHVIPLVQRGVRLPVVFYCHFPDLLLTRERRGLYALYRKPIDRLEERGLARADRILVNSEFTARAFRRAFPRLTDKPLDLLHPGVADTSPAPPWQAAPDGSTTLLCLARYAPEKNVALALEAFAALRTRVRAECFARLELVVAGGLDAEQTASRGTLVALRALADRLGVRAQVSFRLSVSASERRELLERAACLLHTAEAEHFGLAPLEAMAAGRPVVAVDAGGPRETVLHARTGFLCAPTPEAFADALAKLVEDGALVRRLGAAGRERVAAKFSLGRFARDLDALVRETAAGSGTGKER